MVITGAGAGADPAVLSATSLAKVPMALVLVGITEFFMEFFSDCIMLA